MRTNNLTAIIAAALISWCLNLPCIAQEKGALPLASLQWVRPKIDAPGLEQQIFWSEAAKTQVSYHVYKPAVYEENPARRFPVVYWLHGSGGGSVGVEVVSRYFGKAIEAGKIPPVIVVFPNGLRNRMWCDSKDGKTPIETIIVKELIPHVDSHYRTIASRDARVVEGFSMGGYGALRLAFKYNNLFGAVSSLAGGPLQEELKQTPRVGPAARERLLRIVYGGDQEYFKSLSPWRLAELHAEELRKARTIIRLVVGEKDETLPANRRFHGHLSRLRIPHEFTILPGVGHDPRAVLRMLSERDWAFYRKVFG